MMSKWLLLADQAGVPTTVVVGIGGIAAFVGAGVAWGIVRAQLNQALAWCKKLEDELAKVSDQCNWNTRKIERFKGRMEAAEQGQSGRPFRSDETHEFKRR